MTDLISVIIPTFGRPNFLVRAVNSVLLQTHGNVEVIVVDDNLPDSLHRSGTEMIMSDLMRDPRVKYFKHQENRKGSAARNTGLRAAKGVFVSFLDDDDELLPLKLEKQIMLLKQKPQYKAVYCFNTSFYNGHALRTTTYNRCGDCTFDILSLRSDIHTSSLLMCRESVIAIGGFDETFVRHQEFEFMVRFFDKFKMCCFPEVLLHVHTDSSMNRPDVDRLVAAKQHYYAKMDGFIKKLSPEQQAEMFKAHNLHLFRTCVKNFDLRALKYLYLSRPNCHDFSVHFSPFFQKYIMLAIVRLKKRIFYVKW